MYRICNNPNCGVVIDEQSCMDYRHPTGARLCPECYETTEEIQDSSMLFNRDGLILCSMCMRLFGYDDAKIATEHIMGVLVTSHLCVEHTLERYHVHPGGRQRES